MTFLVLIASVILCLNKCVRPFILLAVTGEPHARLETPEHQHIFVMHSKSTNNGRTAVDLAPILINFILSLVLRLQTAGGFHSTCCRCSHQLYNNVVLHTAACLDHHVLHPSVACWSSFTAPAPANGSNARQNYVWIHLLVIAPNHKIQNARASCSRLSTHRSVRVSKKAFAA